MMIPTIDDVPAQAELSADAVVAMIAADLCPRAFVSFGLPRLAAMPECRVFAVDAPEDAPQVEDRGPAPAPETFLMNRRAGRKPHPLGNRPPFVDLVAISAGYPPSQRVAILAALRELSHARTVVILLRPPTSAADAELAADLAMLSAYASGIEAVALPDAMPGLLAAGIDFPAPVPQRGGGGGNRRSAGRCVS